MDESKKLEKVKISHTQRLEKLVFQNRFWGIQSESLYCTYIYSDRRNETLFSFLTDQNNYGQNISKKNISKYEYTCSNKI